MNILKILEFQKKNLLFHRFIYIFFVVYVLICYMTKDIVDFKYVITSISITLLFMLLEEVLVFLKFFNNIYLLRAFRLCEYSFVVFATFKSHENVFLSILFFSIMVLFIFDFFITIDFEDEFVVVLELILLCIPFVIVGVMQKQYYEPYRWIYYIVVCCIFMLIISSISVTIMHILKDYNNTMGKQIFLTSKIESANADLINYQKKMQSVNQELNFQKVQLEKAYLGIKQVNDEMSTQAETLKYIASSFDIPKIINAVAESILAVRNPGFCSIYIEKDVYLNKYPGIVIKTEIASLFHKIKEEIEDIYRDYKDKTMDVTIDKNFEDNRYYFLREVNINSLLFMPLCQDGNMYGLLIVGDRKESSFDDNISFYEAIISQLNIAVKNTQIYNKIENMARKDGLTGINNRTYFNVLYADALDETIHNDKNISVALLDIDFFKNVNDTYGHLMGDEVIKAIALIIEDISQEYGGFVCRYGGEEFVIVLPGMNAETSLPIMENIHDTIKTSIIEYDGISIQVDVSIGLSSYPELCKEPLELLKRADWSMYYSKDHGRGCITVDNDKVIE